MILRPVAESDLPVFFEHQADHGSIRVLEKCGFQRTGEAHGYANARGEEIDELIYELAHERTETDSLE